MRIILYTGKGGVGKTSVAAATACRLAAEGKRVLILSTDQAHSLRDSFECTIGDREVKLEDNLYAMEIDAEKESEAAWGRMQGYFKLLLTARANQGLETEELLVFPGLEELFSLLKLLQIKEEGKYDVVLVDCAPTGETLSLLRFPEMFGNFIERVLPSKKKLVHFAGPAVTKLTKLPMPEDGVFDELSNLNQRLAQMQQLMQDKTQVSIRIVTTPERIVIREAKRNFTWLQMYDYNVDAVVVNRVYPAPALNGYFSRWISLQEDGLREIRESFHSTPIFELNLKRQELKSIPLLKEAAEELFGTTDVAAVLHCKKSFELEQSKDGALLRILLPFAAKEEIELSQEGEELILKLENITRRFLLPDPVRNQQIKKAEFREGALEIHLGTEEME